MSQKVVVRNGEGFVVVIEESPRNMSGFDKYSDFHCLVCHERGDQLVDLVVFNVMARALSDAFGVNRSDIIIDKGPSRVLADADLNITQADPAQIKYFCYEMFVSDYRRTRK